MGYSTTMRVTLRIAILAFTVFPSTAIAQSMPSEWSGLRLSGLPTVYVLDDTGQETIGTLLRLETAALVLATDGTERRIEAARIRRIEKHGDSLKNGTIIGLVVGAVMGLITSGISDCPGDAPSGSCPGTRTAAFLVSTGVYTALGTGVDALITGRTLLYEAPGSRPSSLTGRVLPGASRSPAVLTFHAAIRW